MVRKDGMTTTPKVSICIPTYNQAQFITECLQSALGQTFEDLEVVLSINHCTDNTEEVVARFGSDPRLRVVRPPVFLSSGENFRFVVTQARGSYFNYLSSDDMLHSDFVAEQIDILERNPNVAFSFTAGELVDEHGKVCAVNRPLDPPYIRSGRSELERYIMWMRATGIALLIRRSAYEATGGFRTEIVDAEICLKLLCHGDVAYNNRILARVRIWTDEVRRTARRIAMIDWKRTYLEECEHYVCARYPELRPLFKKSRTRLAALETLTLDEYDPQQRRQAVEAILRLSSAPRVRARVLLAGAPGFNPSLRAAHWVENRLRLAAKRVLMGSKGWAS